MNTVVILHRLKKLKLVSFIQNLKRNDVYKQRFINISNHSPPPFFIVYIPQLCAVLAHASSEAIIS